MYKLSHPIAWHKGYVAGVLGDDTNPYAEGDSSHDAWLAAYAEGECETECESNQGENNAVS